MNKDYKLTYEWNLASRISTLLPHCTLTKEDIDTLIEIRSYLEEIAINS